MVDIQSATAENREEKGKKKRKKEEKPHDKNIIACPIRRAAMIND